MTKKTLRCAPAPAFIESLENRTLMSVSAGEVVHLDKAKPITPHTTIHLSKHAAKLGQSITVSVSVTAPRKLGTLAGSVEFFDGNNPIQGTSGTFTLPLGPKNRVSYTFGAGDVGLYLGRQSVAAAFISSNSVPNSISKATLVNIKLPKLKTATDGLETTTVVGGHGKAIKAGQTATVLYTGFLASTGQVFDYATADHGAGSSPTFSFTVQASPEQVITGFDQGTLGMKVGETRVLAIPSQLGYGPGGSGSIPANADLVFFIKLLSIT